LDKEKKHMDSDNLDGLIKNHYKNHSVDPEAPLWDRISFQMDQKLLLKKSRQIRQLRIGGSFMGVAIIASLIFFLTSIEDKNQTIESLREESSRNLNSESVPLQAIEDNHLKQSAESDPAEIDQDADASGSEGSQPVTLSSGSPAKQEVRPQGQNEVPGPYSTDPNPHLVQTPSSIELTKHTAQEPSVVLDRKLSEMDTETGNPNLLNEAVAPKTRKHPVFLEGFVSPELTYRSLATNPLFEGPETEKSYFNESEAPLLTYSVGFLGGFEIRPGLSFKSGLYYSNYSLDFKTDAYQIEEDSLGEYSIYTSPGQSFVSITSTDSIPAGTFIQSKLNFSYLNLPLIAEIQLGRRFFMDLGLNFNYLIAQNINWESDSQDVNSNDDSSQNIKDLNSFSFGAILGVGYRQPIGKNLDFYATPTFRTHITTLSKMSPVKSYPYSWGIKVGLRYNILNTDH